LSSIAADEVDVSSRVGCCAVATTAAIATTTTTHNHTGTEMGLHVSSQTFIDPEVLLEEFALSADMLTHGLVCE
jgi:hypothetical protein